MTLFYRAATLVPYISQNNLRAVVAVVEWSVRSGRQLISVVVFESDAACVAVTASSGTNTEPTYLSSSDALFLPVSVCICLLHDS